MKVLRALAVAVALAGACTSTDDRIDEAGASSTWDGYRLGPDGRELSIALSGSPAYRASDPCSAEYFGEAEETDHEVRVTLRARSPRPPSEDFRCDAVGHRRTVTVRFDTPLGDRRLVDAEGRVLTPTP